MNCVSIRTTSLAERCCAWRALERRSPRGFSLLEMLLALAVASAFMVGAFASYMQVMRSQESAEARLEAMRNGRAALSKMSEELKAINSSGTDTLLQGMDFTLDYGNGIDEDGDGQIDEEILDGRDDDAGAADFLEADRHILLDLHYERPSAIGRTDRGDRDVDEDVRFGRDQITFNLYTTPPQPESVLKTVSYAIGEFDGEPNVPIRTVMIQDAEGALTVLPPAPLAFGVLGLDLLYWDPNAPPEQQNWVSSWDSQFASVFNPPQLPLPASILMRLTLYADRRPLEAWQPGQPVETLVLETMVNIEETIGNFSYPRPSL